MRRSNSKSKSWDYFIEIDPDIALLQEVGKIPKEIEKDYSCLIKNATKKNGGEQHIGTAIMVI